MGLLIKWGDPRSALGGVDLGHLSLSFSLSLSLSVSLSKSLALSLSLSISLFLSLSLSLSFYLSLSLSDTHTHTLSLSLYVSLSAPPSPHPPPFLPSPFDDLTRRVRRASDPRSGAASAGRRLLCGELKLCSVGCRPDLITDAGNICEDADS